MRILTFAVLAMLVQAPVVSVRLDRGPCYGSCPSDTIILRTDGTASYSGYLNAPRDGDFDGRVRKESVQRLLRQLKERGFDSMTDGFTNIDVSTYILSIERGGKVKTVITSDTDGRREVRTLKDLVLEAARDAHWTPVSSGIRLSINRPGAAAFLGPVQIECIPADPSREYYARALAGGRIPLRPGKYIVGLKGFPFDRVPPKKTVIVTAGKYTDVRLDP
jgi:Domain of unknown function (DUF6438)